MQTACSASRVVNPKMVMARGSGFPETGPQEALRTVPEPKDAEGRNLCRRFGVRIRPLPPSSPVKERET